ncbi:MAG: hypothetical protein MUF71_15105 [Candidatus Kapabacteria bacterium]|jgi:hypothetical protein|nr:hypothetical protein [Candidatus Kapabacteria bacterium]
MKLSRLFTGAALALVLPLCAFAQTKSSAPAPQSEGTVTKTSSAQVAPVRTKTSKPVKGVVVNLLTLKRINAQEASTLPNKSVLALLVGSRIVYVFKADGTSVGDDLARLADAPVGVIGRTLSRNGVTVMLADIVDTMK